MEDCLETTSTTSSSPIEPSSSISTAASFNDDVFHVKESGRSLCVFAHGMWGNCDDWAVWLEVLARRCPAWILRPLNTLVSGARPLASGVDTLATLAAEEVLKTLSELGPGPITLHCLGHSMGGLALRGALPRILDGAPRLTPGVFMTLSTPHLGVLASWGEPQAMWRNLSFLTGAISTQLPQLAIQDRTGDGGEPYLVSLADPDGPYMFALGRFSRRVCCAMGAGDAIVPTSSATVSAKRWAKLEPPEEQAAGWGIAEHTGYGEQGVTARRPHGVVRTRSATRCVVTEQDTWNTSEDGCCCFPEQVLAGLESVPWERVVVWLHMPKTNPHIFLIAKTVEQIRLENVFARNCVKKLAEILVQEASSQPVVLSAPVWTHTVQVSFCQRCRCAGKWTVATEQGVGNVFFYPFDGEDEAGWYFDTLSCCRVMYDPWAAERRRAGINRGALRNIRKAYLVGLDTVHDLQSEWSPRARSQSPSSESSVSVAGDIQGSWTVVTEDGVNNMKFYSYDEERLAQRAFKKYLCRSRILYDPSGLEVARGGWNVLAYPTIAKAYSEKMAQTDMLS